MGRISTLKDTQPFNLLPDEVVTRLEQAALIRKFPPHIHIFNQNDPPTGYLYIVRRGLVEIVATTPGGVEMVVDLRSDGSFFGCTPILTNESYTAGARTAKETECYLIPAELIAETVRDYPDVADFFTRAVYSRVRSLYADMVSDHAQSALTQMEAYPFKKRLSEIMTSPVITCDGKATARDVARTMTRHGIGAIVVSNERNRADGIITQNDLVTKVLARDSANPAELTAERIMTPSPLTLPPSAYMYEAATFMMARRIKHLPVVDNGELVGIISLRDLMKYRSQKSMLLVGSVKEAKNLDDLARAKQEIVKVAKGLMSETRSPFETMEILSYIHHCILRRGYELVLEQMRAEGMVPPPIRHCFIIMGSGGRKEMLLGPDQDNGFIFEDFPEEMRQEVDAFFVPFAERLVAAYAAIGYPLCNGKVMANNPLWRGRLQDWKERITEWIRVPEPQRVRYSTIFFDFMPLVGDTSLCQDLRDIVHLLIRETPVFLYHLMELDFQHKVPLSLLGRFVVEKDDEIRGKLSLKQAGSIFIVDCVRIFMLEQGFEATTTIERLDELVKRGVFTQDTAEHLKAALEAFTFLRLRNEINLIEQGKKPTHYLDPYALSRIEQDLLKEAFRAAGKLQDSTRRHFSRLVH
ncbi:CBS domain-containing protein [Geothermobacter ehrlichii]|uniref:CBS domain-containing protein n=1 Tax=Geothermobacter ehrlichii TaxID=213224 RepID=A0A5D3WKA0_9BACT|nr:putative nucleotidyltransferase substrate binding domain-containing protein [Geothermobacter ehrlichii]TYO98330.1 CBS domain-containing protein [Geothermobacter ehrlichii]